MAANSILGDDKKTPISSAEVLAAETNEEEGEAVGLAGTMPAAENVLGVGHALRS